MELRITVSANGMYGSATAVVKVAEPYTRAFEPLRTTDEPFMALANAEVMPDSAQAKAVTKLREETAAEIAEALTKQLIDMMKKNDTFNGYEDA